MRVTYFALKTITVGSDIRQPGDLVPEAGEWPRLSAHLSSGELAPVLVVTLPEDVQDMLLEWETERSNPVATETVASEPVAEQPKRRGRPPAKKEGEVA